MLWFFQFGSRVSLLIALMLAVAPASANQADPIADDTIAALQEQLSEAIQATSPARQKIALRRVVREAEAVIEKNPAEPNRFEVLEVLFRTQQVLFKLQADEASRRAILETCEKLVQAPDEYAEIRWDADLLLSQSQIARQGGDARQRSAALRELVERYLGTSAEKKAVRVTLLLAVESGASRLIEYLDTLISERFADDLAMIAYKREKLPGRVFGATLFAELRDTKGNIFRFPGDSFGTTTALYFWSNNEYGQANLKEIAEVLSRKPIDSERRLVIYSVNLDGLPDAGESILREHGIEWPALHLPEGRDSLIYKAYARVDPKFVTVSPTGIASLFQTGGNMHGKGFERWAGSSAARSWVDPYYCHKLQSLASAEFLILDPRGKFDPAAPPELMALSPDATAKTPLLKRTDQSVPEATIRAIQACFIAPPRRYDATYEEVAAGYEKAEQLCAEAIKAHPDAPDLWLIRNRHMVALLGLWKIKLDNQYLNAAAAEAKAAVQAGYPEGADAIARLCLARQALHEPGADVRQSIDGLAQGKDGEHAAAPALAMAALVAMEVGDRDAYAAIRQTLLEQYSDEPVLWPLTGFMLDRYHRFWLYQIPFVSGWIYERRKAYGINSFAAEPSIRHFDLPLQALDGEPARLLGEAEDKWVMLRFIKPELVARLGPEPVVASRPFKDIKVFDILLDGDVEALRGELAKRRSPMHYPVLFMSDAVRDRFDRMFGLSHEGKGYSTIILRPDGSVALASSSLAHQATSRYGGVTSAFFLQQDEAEVQDALSKGDLNEAKRLAFAYAPTSLPVDKQATEHLRARAAVYMAMEDWKAALADVEVVFGRLVEDAGLMGMLTKELDEIEQLRDHLLEVSGRAD